MIADSGAGLTQAQCLASGGSLSLLKWSCGQDRPALSYFHAAFHALKQKPNKKASWPWPEKQEIKKEKKKEKEMKTETVNHLFAMSTVEPLQICVILHLPVIM